MTPLFQGVLLNKGGNISVGKTKPCRVKLGHEQQRLEQTS